MYEQTKNHKFYTFENFLDISQLSNWLISKDIDLAVWGRGSSKSLENLWDEIKLGETVLSDIKPWRRVFLVRVIIRNGDKILVEREQILSDGRRRQRNSPPAEKVRLGECVTTAALRCLKEELGLTPNQVLLDNDSHSYSVENANSFSYPGLDTCYLIHTIDAFSNSLPAHEFWTPESVESILDPVRFHQWDWQSLI